MISLAALFSFQGTDRPKATRRSPGEPRLETGWQSYEIPGSLSMKIVAETQIFRDLPLASRRKLPIRGRKLRPEIPYDEKSLSREGNGMIGPARPAVKRQFGCFAGRRRSTGRPFPSTLASDTPAGRSASIRSRGENRDRDHPHGAAAPGNGTVETTGSRARINPGGRRARRARG
jgi:hypothetical protein